MTILSKLLRLLRPTQPPQHTHEWARVDASEDAPDGYVRKLAGHYCRLCGMYREVGDVR